jgi:drug/metabolite transporter (DMT)-like permease
MKTSFTNWILLIVLALIWGSSFILMKRGLEVYSSSQVAALRIFIAFIFLSPLLFKYFKLNYSKHWKAFLGMGMFGNFIPAFLFTKAETGISSSLTGMLNSLTPLFTLVLGVMFFNAKTKRVNIIGVIIGFIGAIGLLAGSNSDQNNSNLFFGIYVLIATLCYGISVNIIKKHLNEMNSITATVWALTLIGPLAGIYLFGFTDFSLRVQQINGAVQSLGYICLLAVFGTAISVILFNVLVKNTNTLFASSVTYLIPIVAMLWGALDGEKINAAHFIWIAIILAGVYLVNAKPKSN